MSHTEGLLAVNVDRIESKDDHGWINDGWIIAQCQGPDAIANARRLVACWNEHDELVAERDRYKKRCQELREGGLKLIEDHSQRTLDAINLRQERDEALEALRNIERVSGLAMMQDDPARVAARAILSKHKDRP